MRLIHGRRSALLNGSLAALFALLLLATAACGDDDDSGSSPSGGAAESGTVYVGDLLGVPGLVGIHINEPDANGKRLIRAYVCDGLPGDQGGFALWFKGEATSAEFSLTAPKTADRLTLTLGDVAAGSVTFADGRKATFKAPVATDGSGIYDVKVGSDGSYTGRSSAGDVLTGTISLPAATRRYVVSGTLTQKGQVAVSFFSMKNSDGAFAVDSFVAVATLTGPADAPARVRVEMAGRSGNVRGGSSGLNIIGTCASC